MSEWIVYGKDGLTEKCRVKNLQYEGEFMGACSLTVNISSPSPVNFELGDYMEYRGERFEINYDPSVVKQSAIETDGEGFVYESVVFNSLSDELTRCDFLDYVAYDNELHYSSLPNFSFFADNISKLAERIQVNLDRIYTGSKKWTVNVHPEYVNTLNVNIQANNNTVWDALGFVNSKFGANFIIRGRTITIGTTGVAVGNVFSYGKGNGLYKIERNAESSQKIITRLRAYGSTRNMPTDYYKNVEGGDVPNNMAVKNLMLPSFPVNTHDPYIDSDNIDELGIREGTVFFDGSGDLEEIYPTMEGMTAEDLAEAGITVNATGALDEVLSAEQITDNGLFEPAEGEETVTIPTFTITLKDVGFDINDYLTTSSATISMKDGMCGGRDFEIVSCEKSGSNYVLTCNRHYDESLDLYFPYNDYQIKGGDKFVLLNIEMPDVYIKAASERLLKAAKAYLAKNDYVRYSYTLTVDNVFMARQHDEAVKNGGKSIHDTIKEGDLIVFEDEDLGINGSVTISSLSIKEDMESSLIPEYEITLKDEKTVGSIEKIQNQITSILAGGIGSGTELNTEQLRSLIELYGSKIFLRKDKDDRSKGKISTDKALEVGKFVAGASGAIIQVDAKNGQTIAELDKLYVRMKAYFETLEIINVNSIGGKMILSPAGSVTCLGVEELDDAYRCYFLGEQDGEIIENRWVEGMQAYSQMFNAKEGVSNKVSNTYYWRLVTSVSEDTVEYNNQKCHYIDLSKTDCDSGSDIPKAGDVINHRGCRNDVDYMNFIEFSSVGTNAPYITLFQGVNSYSLTNKEYVSFGYDQSTGKAYMNVYGDMYVGDRNETSYMRYTPETGLQIKGTLDISTKLGDATLKDLISASTPEGYQEFVEKITQDIDNLQNQIDGAIDAYFFDYDPTLGNYPTVEWDTDSEKEAHLGDTFTNNVSGDSWRWGLVEGEYQWIYIEDTATKKALATASKAQDTADGKRRVFVGTDTPTVPYDKGDLWSRGKDYPLLICEVSKNESQSYAESDWDYADNTEKLNAEMKELVNTTKSELEQSVTDAESAMKDYSDEAKAELQKNIDAVNAAKANISDVYDKATVDGMIDTAEADAIAKANEVAQAERELLEVRVKAYADGEIDAAEQEAINEAQKRVDAAKADLESAMEALETELRELVNTTASNLNTAIDEAEKAANEYTDNAKADLQTTIDEMETAKANLADVYTKSQADEQISQAETDAINAAKAQADAAIALSETTIKAYADGIVDDEEKARIEQAKANLEEAKAYAEEKANEAFNNAMEELAGYEYLKKALAEDTSVEGGLIQTSLIKLGYTGSSGYVVMAGSNGTLDTNLGDKSIAFWAGGDMLDRENGSNVSNAADFLVRMDGSGYAAGGNLSWDVTGKITADPMSFFVGEDTVSALLRAFTVTYNSGNVPTLITPNAPFGVFNVSGATTLASTLSVTGDITAKSKLLFGDIPMYKSQDGVVYIEGNLVVQGGITMYGIGSTDVPSIIDSLPTASTSSKGIAYFDSNYFSVSSDGKVSFIGETGGLDTTELQNYLTQNSYINVTEGDGRYLKLSGGGTLTGVITMSINYQIQWGSRETMIYGDSTNNMRLYGAKLLFNDNEVWHSGNFTPSNYLLLSGGIMDSGAGIYNSNDANSGYGAIGFNSTENCFGAPTFPTTLRSSKAIRVNIAGTYTDLIHSGNYSSYLGYVGYSKVNAASSEQTLEGINGLRTTGLNAGTIGAQNAPYRTVFSNEIRSGHDNNNLWLIGSKVTNSYGIVFARMANNELTECARINAHGLVWSTGVTGRFMTTDTNFIFNVNGSANSSIVIDTASLRPNTDANTLMNLGASNARWKEIFASSWIQTNDGNTGLAMLPTGEIRMFTPSNTSTAWAKGYNVYSNDGGAFLSYSIGVYGIGESVKYAFLGGMSYQSPALVALASNKYIGINTTSPTRRLTVSDDEYRVLCVHRSKEGTYGSAIEFSSTDNIYGTVGFDGGGYFAVLRNNYTIPMISASTSHGYVGINMAYPEYNLDINGSTGFRGHLYLTGAVENSSTANTSQIVFGTASSQHVCITSNLSAVIINPTPESTTGQVYLGVGTKNSYFNSTGYFGIGTTAPSYKLDVRGTIGTAGHIYMTGVDSTSSVSNTTQLIFGTPSTQRIAVSAVQSGLVLNPTTTTTTGQIVLGINGGNTEFKSSGNFGIGVSSPSYKLHVVGSTYLNGDVYVDTLNTYSILPRASVTYGLGSSSSKWKDVYTESVIANYVHGGGKALYLGNSGNTSYIYVHEDMKASSENWSLNTSGAMSLSSTLNVKGLVTATGNMTGDYWFINDTVSNPYIRLNQGSSWFIQGYSGYLYLGAGSTKSLRIDSEGNVLTVGGITMYSDQRKKTILRDVELSLKEVANAPLIEHYYNSDDKKTTHVGSIAQYWASMNDWFCKLDSEGYYTMEIQNAALASAISVARELDRYETKTDKTIKQLKKRICELEEEVERLKAS